MKSSSDDSGAADPSTGLDTRGLPHKLADRLVDAGAEVAMPSSCRAALVVHINMEFERPLLPKRIHNDVKTAHRHL